MLTFRLLNRRPWRPTEVSGHCLEEHTQETTLTNIVKHCFNIDKHPSNTNWTNIVKHPSNTDWTLSNTEVSGHCLEGSTQEITLTNIHKTLTLSNTNIVKHWLNKHLQTLLNTVWKNIQETTLRNIHQTLTELSGREHTRNHIDKH